MSYLKSSVLSAVFMILVGATVTAVSVHCDEASAARDTQKCSKHIYRFLRKFSWQKADDLPTGESVCGWYSALKNCMAPTFNSCPHMKEVFLKSWGEVYSVMNSSCSDDRTESTYKLQCVMSQFNSVLARRCDVMFKFHKTQKAFSECRLMQEAVSCKTALVESACPGTSDVAFQIAKLTFDHVTLTDATDCNVKKETHFRGFRYSPTCSKSFISEMDTCKVKYLDSMQRLAFYSENDLIADGKRHDVRRACRAYWRYEACMSPIRLRCRDGVRYVYETNTSLRIYVSKLRIICDTSSKGYIRNLPCLQKTVLNKSLEVCNPVWYVVRTHLQKMTSLQFYCQREYLQSSQNSYSQVHRELGDLQTCYEQAYENSCGLVAGSVMADLMQVVRQDPYYLRFQYRADCSLSDSGATRTTPSNTQPTKAKNCVHSHTQNKTHPVNNRTVDNIKRQTRTEAFTNSAFQNNMVFVTVSFVYLLAVVMVT